MHLRAQPRLRRSPRRRPIGPAPATHASNGRGPVYASPAVRRLARELGVDLTQVAGSGRKGRIIKDDVQTVHRGRRRPGGS